MTNTNQMPEMIVAFAYTGWNNIYGQWTAGPFIRDRDTSYTLSSRYDEMKNSLLVQNEQLRKALEYYADAKQYIEGEYGYQMVAPIEFDKGQKAVKALTETK